MYQEFLAPAAPLHSVDVPDWASILRAHFGTAIFQDWFAQLSSLGVDQHGVISLATKGLIHKNAAARYVSGLMRRPAASVAPKA